MTWTMPYLSLVHHEKPSVRLPDIYTYKLIDADTVHYTNVAADPSGDCHEEYDFTERRIRG